MLFQWPIRDYLSFYKQEYNSLQIAKLLLQPFSILYPPLRVAIIETEAKSLSDDMLNLSAFLGQANKKVLMLFHPRASRNMLFR